VTTNEIMLGNIVLGMGHIGKC